MRYLYTMRTHRSIKHWLLQLIILAGLLTYADGVAISVPPTTEVSSWVHTPDIGSRHKVAHFNSIHRILNIRAIGFTLFQFNTYLSNANGKERTAVLDKRETFLLCATTRLQFIVQCTPRLNLPRIAA